MRMKVSVEVMEADLRRLGWQTWKGHKTQWLSPDGYRYRGPYGAWRLAMANANERSNK